MALCKKKLAQNVSPHVAEILERLGHKKAEIQASALAEVHTLSKSEIDDLLNLMAAETASHRRRYRLFWRILIGYFALLGSVAAYYFCYRLFVGSFPFKFPSGLTQVLTYTGIFSGAVAAGDVQKRGARVLSRIDDVRAVGFLVDALTHNDKQVEEDARTALIAMLPKLKASDAGLLDRDQRGTLNKGLKTSKFQELRGAILTALEQVGDEVAIPVVRSIAENPEDPLQANAAACLPALIVSADRIKAGSTLLRAVDAPQDTQNLLRPAGISDVESVSTLLRPAVYEESEAVTLSSGSGHHT